MAPSATIPPDEAAKTLESVRTARESAQERLGPYWFPFLVLGGLVFASQWFYGLWNGAGIVAFWAVAAPVAMLLMARHQRGEASATGAVRRGGLLANVTAGFAGVSVVFGAVGAATGDTYLVHYGPPCFVAALITVFALRDRSIGDYAWAVVSIAVVALMIAIGFDDGAQYCAFGFGGGLAIQGLARRNRAPE